jgi:hypothetical protein
MGALVPASQVLDPVAWPFEELRIDENDMTWLPS